MKKLTLVAFTFICAQLSLSAFAGQAEVEACRKEFNGTSSVFQMALNKELGVLKPDGLGGESYQIDDVYHRGLAAGFLRSVDGVLEAICALKN